MQKKRAKIKQQGFSLLEAIVALVLLAGTGMALFSWINTSLISLHRVQQAQHRNVAIRNALAFMDLINPLQQPLGDETVGIYRFNWRARIVDGPKDGVNKMGFPGYYQMGLYDTEVEVWAANKLIAQFNLRQTGFKQVREPSFEF